MSYIKILKELKKLSSKEKSKSSAWFFKTGIGQYGYGDIFLGVTVPECRGIAKSYKDLVMSEITKLLKDPHHEARLIALYLLVFKFDKGNSKEKKDIFNLYLNHTKYINNWDLVDTSAHHVVGKYLYKKERNILYRLAKSKNLWERRIAIVATYYFIKQNDFKDTLELTEILSNDKEDLIHKACGWMLREVGKMDKNVLINFLDLNAKFLPRTSLRYAIEKFNPKEKISYMKIKRCV